MFKKDKSTKALLILTLLALTVTQIQAACKKNEKRPENKAACAGHIYGGLVSYPGNCSKYLVCRPICEYPAVKQCPAGLWWDNRYKFCNLPKLVDCNDRVAETTTTTQATYTTTRDTTQTTKRSCNNEPRPENREACAEQRNGDKVSYPGDCTKYLVCLHHCDYPTVVQCSAGLWWDNIHKYCNTPLLVDCDSSSGTTTPLDKTTEEQTTTTATTTTTEMGNWGYDCVAPEGMSADICFNYNNKFLIKYPYNCNAYINCTMGCPVMNYCQADKVFNSVLKICDTPDVNDCEELPASSTTTTDKSIITTTEMSLSPSELCTNQDSGSTFPYQQNCQQYIYCNGSGGFLILSCPYGNYYSINSRHCVSSDDSEICL